MKKALILFAALSALTACAVDPALAQLLRPRLSARTSYMSSPPRTHAYPAWVEPSRGYMSGGETGLTYIVWMRYAYSSTHTFNPFVVASCTVDAARPTRDGGAGLTNLVTGTLVGAQPIDVSGGSWSSQCLTAYDCPESLADQDWQYGCYTINLTTDTPLTLTVADTELYVPATNGMVRNIMGSSSSRYVTIVPESTSATVEFGIAEQPLHQFIGAQNDGTGAGIQFDVDQGGLAERWRMAVFRARIEGANVIARMDMWTPGGKCPKEQCVTQAMWRARATFEKDAMVRMSCASMGLLDEMEIGTCMAKLLDGWAEDAWLERVRDCDVVEFQRQGYVFPELATDYREIEVVFSNSTEVVSEATATTTNDQSYAWNSVKQITSRQATATVVNGVNYDGPYNDADYVISCEGATVDGHVITFPSSGNYTVRATDPDGGFVTNVVTASGPYTSTVARLEYVQDGGSAAAFNAAVRQSLVAATNDGVLYAYVNGTATNKYYKWKCRRLWPCPSACVSGSGHYAKHVISPHVVATAAHYGWWPAAQLTYTAEDGTTATVTPTNVVNARTWALAHGFTSEEVTAADCSDLVLISVDGAIPDGCCPYFMTTNTWASACPGPFGILGWRGTQTDLGMALPVLVNPDISIASYAGRSAKWSWSRDFPYQTNAYSWASAPAMMAGNLFAGVTPPTLFAPTYGGDSGMPIFLEDSSGRLILIGNHYSTINGTSYVRAFKIVKAFAEAHGDTIKEWSAD